MRRARVIIVFCLILSLAFGSIASADEVVRESPPERQTVSIAALLPLSGELASKGEIRRFAIEQAVKEVNAEGPLADAGWSIKLTVADSGSDPDTVLRKARALHEQGVRIFIAGSSAEIEALREWSTEVEAVILSYSSTSPSLAVAGDNVFRMVPNDLQQAKAIAALLVSENIYGIVPVYRDDLYGRDLGRLVAVEFEDVHGMVAEAVVYAPDVEDWDEVVRTIREQTEALPFQSDQIAIVLAAFDEASELLSRADQLPGVRWFGSDTVTLSPALASEQAVTGAVEARLTGVNFGIADTIEYEQLLNMFAKQGFEEVLPDALFAYDIPGMLGSVLSQLDDPLDANELSKRMVELSEMYAGVTGWTLLDEQGDRKYYQYGIWTFAEDGWSNTGTYTRHPGAPGYIIPVDTIDNGDDMSFLFGYVDDVYDAGRALTRAEFTYMLTQTMQVESSGALSPSFADADQIDLRAYSSVGAAEALGWINGYESGEFRPSQPILLTEALAIVSRAMGWEHPESIPVENVWVVQDWALPYVARAQEVGLIRVTAENEDNLMQTLTLGDGALLILEIFKYLEIGAIELYEHD